MGKEVEARPGCGFEVQLLGTLLAVADSIGRISEGGSGAVSSAFSQHQCQLLQLQSQNDPGVLCPSFGFEGMGGKELRGRGLK